jgi:hypothetical protein
MINRERGGGETRRFPQFFEGLQLIPPLEKKIQKGFPYVEGENPLGRDY